MNSQVFFM